MKSSAFLLITAVSWLCALPKSRAFVPSITLQLTTSRCGPPPSRLCLFLGNNNNDKLDKENKQLVFYPKLATSNIDVKFDSLVGFLATWSMKFEEDRKGMGLTTPVKVVPLHEEELHEGVEERGGVRILFQPTKTGSSYQNKSEEDDARAEGGESKNEKTPQKEGGVEIRVEKLSNGEVQLLAKRCEVDEDTMIKEMSEETILSQLKKAMEAWKKQ